MARKRYTAEEIIGHLRTVEIDLGKGSAVPEACRKLGITEQTYYRWKKESGWDDAWIIPRRASRRGAAMTARIT
jgi:transposase-like protein